MSNPLWIDKREPTHGVNSDGYADVSNRPCRTIWSNFTAQHNKDGTHKADLTADLSKMEQGTYTGNGTDPRTLTLTDTTLIPVVVFIFSADCAFTFWATPELLVTGDSLSTQGYISTAWIDSVATGAIILHAADQTNKTGIVYNYIVYGT